MRVLHIGKYYPPFHGGMEYFLRDLAIAQANAETTTGVFVHNHSFGGPLQREQDTTRPQLHIIRAASYGKLLFAPISPAFGLHIKREIALFNPNLLHIHLPNPSAFQLLVMAKARQIPWVTHWHSDVLTPQSSAAIRFAYRFYRPFEQAMLRQSHTIVATSPNYLKSSLALQPWQEKCTVIPLGIDENRIMTGLAHAPDPPPHNQPLHILAVGRLTYYKGFEILLRALKKLQNARLTLVGEGDQKKQLKTLIESLGISSRVQFLNNLPQAELTQQMTSCDCLCLPSIERTEAFGMVLIEAMAHGKSVVATKVEGSGMSWVVKQGINGLLAIPGNPDSLACELNKLATDRQYSQLLGTRGRQDFHERFRIEKVVEKLGTVYARCLSSAVN